MYPYKTYIWHRKNNLIFKRIPPSLPLSLPLSYLPPSPPLLMCAPPRDTTLTRTTCVRGWLHVQGCDTVSCVGVAARVGVRCHVRGWKKCG